jgi:DNA-binding NarL/FixJ family response regulator
VSATHSGQPPVRVLVVDDQALFRAGMVALLNAERSVSVVGEAADGVEAIELVAALLPDVVLMDLRMPRLDGISATARLAAEHPMVKVLILASLQTDESVVGALRAGAVGYVVKDADRATLVAAIERAARGGHVLGHDAQLALVGAALGRTGPAHPPGGLTSRQLQVLRLMSMGLSLKQVARQLDLSEKTVRNQASLMYARLQVKDRVQAVLYAVHKGLVG